MIKIKYARVEDCFQYIKNGANIKQARDKGGIPITRIETLSGCRFNRDRMGYADIYEVGELADRVLQDGDILMSHINSIPYLGRSVMYRALPGETYIHGMNLLLLRANRALIDPEYAEAFFNTCFFKTQILGIAKKAVNQASFSISDLKSLVIPLPSISEQRKMVCNLRRINRLIEESSGMLSSLDDLVKSRFIEMFGHPVHNDKDLPVATWSEVLTVKNGRNQKQVENPNGEYPICGSGGIMGRANQYITEANSVIIGRKGNINKPILMRQKFWNVDTAFGLEPNAGVMNVEYLYEFCCAFDFEKLNKTVTIPSLTKADLLRISIPIAPMDQQNQFAAFVQQVDKSKFAVQQSIDKLQMLYDSLAQEYFGG